MSAQRDEATQLTLDQLLLEHGLSTETRLYREAMREALIPTETPGVFRLAANAKASESVLDVYGPGYLVQAEQVGPGLAFAESAQPNWQETMELRTLQRARSSPGSAPGDRVEVEVRLQDILRDGGLIYPVSSVTVERAWYCTMPSGFVAVREVP